MSTGPKKVERRGGARPNSGPKKKTLTMGMVEKMIKTAIKWEKKTGKTIDDILMEFIYDQEENGIPVPPPVRMKAIQAFKEHSQAKLKDGSESDQQLGPPVYLPEERPDPVLKVV